MKSDTVRCFSLMQCSHENAFELSSQVYQGTNIWNKWRILSYIIESLGTIFVSVFSTNWSLSILCEKQISAFIHLIPSVVKLLQEKFASTDCVDGLCDGLLVWKKIFYTSDCNYWYKRWIDSSTLATEALQKGYVQV